MCFCVLIASSAGNANVLKVKVLFAPVQIKVRTRKWTDLWKKKRKFKTGVSQKLYILQSPRLAVKLESTTNSH